MSVYVVWLDGEDRCFICDNAELTDTMLIIYYLNGATKSQYIPLNSIRHFSASETLKIRKELS